MKLVQVLASIVTGFAMLATVGSTSARAAEFDLFGTFASVESLGTGLENGSFNGTYSYSGGAVAAGSSEPVSSYSINILNSSGGTVDTFNSIGTNDTANIFGMPDNSNSDVLRFTNPSTRHTLQLKFPTGFQGIGNLTSIYTVFPNLYMGPITSDDVLISVVSATSRPVTQAVPEPSPIVGTLAASAALIVMGLKKPKKQKAF